MLRVISVPVFLLLAFLTSCGYRSGQGGFFTSYNTISIPYAANDRCGDLTAAVAKSIDSNGPLRYTRSQGDYTLLMKIIEISDENIGFRYDQNRKGKRTNSIIPSETRRSMTVEVKVRDERQGVDVLGPVILTESIDFDHDFFSSPHHVNEFSLGQLTDIEDAKDSVQKPLNIKMAQKIVDFLYGSWK